MLLPKKKTVREGKKSSDSHSNWIHKKGESKVQGIKLIYILETVRSITRLSLKYVLIITVCNICRDGRQHSSLKPLNTPTVFHVIYQRDLERMLNSRSLEAIVYIETAEHEALTSNQSNVTQARAFPGRRGEKNGREGRRRGWTAAAFPLALESEDRKWGVRKRDHESRGSVIITSLKEKKSQCLQLLITTWLS